MNFEIQFSAIFHVNCFSALLDVIATPDGNEAYPSFCNGLNGRRGLIPGTVDLDMELAKVSDCK